VSIASLEISTTIAELLGASDRPSCSSWSFLKPESRSFDTSAPIEPPAMIPSGPPRMPIAPPSSAPRPAPQSFDSEKLFAYRVGLVADGLLVESGRRHELHQALLALGCCLVCFSARRQAPTPRREVGLVMQVLVLAAQNAVDHRLLGVATSGSTLFRQVGGSIGVSVFGAIFTSELAHSLPAGVHAPAHAGPAAIQHLPPAIHTVYVTAVAVALHPVFLTAAAVTVLGFGLSWLLRDVPVRETAGVAASGEGFSVPPEVRPSSRDRVAVPAPAPAVRRG
jgi:hypothetical protein